MKVKTYLIALITIVTLLGVFQEQFPVSNQEIVLQFSESEVSKKETQSIIALIKQQLYTVGVHYTQVKKDSGKLKISYYSDIDIASIKKIFGQAHQLQFNISKGNRQDKNRPKNSNHYDLSIYEIQPNLNLNTNLGLNAYAIDIQTKSNIPLNSLNLFGCKTNPKLYTIQTITSIIYKSNTVALYNTLHEIPKVRAGPVA